MRNFTQVMLGAGLTLGTMLTSGAQALRDGQAIPSDATEPRVRDIANRLHSQLESFSSLRFKARLANTDAEQAANEVTVAITCSHEPCGYFAIALNGDSRVVSTAACNGVNTWTTNDQAVLKLPAFAGPDRDRMIVANAATEAAAMTWRTVIDLSWWQSVSDGSLSLAWAGADEIEGELCDVLMLVRNSNSDHDHTCEYIWVSRSTGLPRSLQRAQRARGRMTLAPQIILSEFEAVAEDRDLYQESSVKDSLAKIVSQAVDTDGLETSGVGDRIPRLSLRDLNWQPVEFLRDDGRPKLVTFWAPWCGPCIDEFSDFVELLGQYDESFDVIAIAVMDSSIDVKEWFEAHADLPFDFFMDPHLQEPQSLLRARFGVTAIPHNLLVNPEGTIVDQWTGRKTKDELESKIEGLVKQ